MRLARIGLMVAAVLPCLAPAAQARTARPAGCAASMPEAKRAKPGPTEPLKIATARGVVAIAVEIADTEAERAQGLMCRTAMAADHGMLFDFKAQRPVYFWMKNTYLPLDMIFIGQDGRIAAVAPNATPLSEEPVGPGLPVLAVLELNAGRAAALGIAPGDRVTHRIFGRR